MPKKTLLPHSPRRKRRRQLAPPLLPPYSRGSFRLTLHTAFRAPHLAWAARKFRCHPRCWEECRRLLRELHHGVDPQRPTTKSLEADEA